MARFPSSPQIVNKSIIQTVIDEADHATLITYIEQAFISYSLANAVVPPVGTLTFETPPGEVHIKYGYIKKDPIYVIKIASGFYENAKLGLPSGNGLNLVFDQQTGELKTILLDQGYLTDIRTALAGAVVAKHFAPPKVEAIGIVGTGVQARLQLQYLKPLTDCRKVYVWGRSEEKLTAYQEDMEKQGFEIRTSLDSRVITQHCNLIVTTTPAKAPILKAVNLKKGTLITAMGADTKGKQELDHGILQQADRILVDSLSQCISHGEIHTAYNKGLIKEDDLEEIGNLITLEYEDRDPDAIIIADLTGIATQDIQISQYMLAHMS